MSLKDPTVSYNINDDVFTKVWQIESQDLKIKNPDWGPSLTKLLSVVASKLGVPPPCLSANLDSMLYMERGSSIDWCSNIEEEAHKVGTLLVQLPSSFTGGSFRVYDGEEREEDEEDASKITSFDLGVATGEKEFKCHFLAHYNDCQYEMEKIKSGSRLLLCYSLCFNGAGQLPSAAVLKTSMIPLQQELNELPRHDRIVLVPLARHYSDYSLRQDGLTALAHHHRAKAEAIKVAGKGDWVVLIIQAKKIHTHCYHHNSHTSSSMKHVYSENGNRLTSPKKWLDNIISFAPIEEAVVTQDFSDSDSYGDPFYSERHTQHVDCDYQSIGGAMMLTDSKMVADNWGASKSIKESNCYGRYNEESFDTTYWSTFLLAYDSSSKFELKCLSGGVGVSDAIKTRIVPTNDISLLERLLTVVEDKTHCYVNADCSRSLLEMLLQSEENTSGVISLVNRLLLCSPFIEPDEKLWDTILVAIKRFGWNTLEHSVSLLLCDEDRKKKSARGTRINLPVFLARVEFSMKLTQIGNQAAAIFAKQCVTSCINDLLNTNDTHIIGSLIENYTEKIERIVTQYGWHGHFVQTALGFLINNPGTNQNLLHAGDLVFKLHTTNQCKVTQDCLLAYAKRFATVPYYVLYTNETQYITLLQSILAVVKYGSEEETDKFGETCVLHYNIFCSILKAFEIVESAAQNIDCFSLLRDFMNRCLLQHSTSPDPVRGWKENAPSTHIHMCFERYPTLASSADAAGRFPLHHAVSKSTVPYETLEFIIAKNPAATTSPDPVSNMYPFMSAASVNNAAATFRLLQAGPDLVSGGIEIVNDNSAEACKKRKRTPSLEGR
eukprot:scaffold23809_cov62-Cyclotella_meneghiniana.AAC.8